MGLFNSFFTDNSSESTQSFPWIVLNDLGILESIVSDSHQKPVVIFKHSTRCSISKFALKNFEREYQAGVEVDFYYLDLIAHRAVSNAIAEKFNVVHQSPQILLIKNGVCVYHDSHQDIDFEKLVLKVG
jgi:bacillithiol system protein YtxJ